MKRPLSAKDIQLLSAYLDQQLSDSQTKKVEKRFKEDKAFKIALDDLRLTRRVLRHAPQAKAPHNFTVTPEMVGSRQKGSGLYPTMRLVSSIASILFVVVFLGDMVSGGRLPFTVGSNQANFEAADEAFDDPAQMMTMDMAEEENADTGAVESFSTTEEAPSTREAEDMDADVESVGVSEPGETLAEAEPEMAEDAVGVEPMPTEWKAADDSVGDDLDISTDTISSDSDDVVGGVAEPELDEIENSTESINGKSHFTEIVEISKWLLFIIALISGLISFIYRRR